MSNNKPINTYYNNNTEYKLPNLPNVGYYTNDGITGQNNYNSLNELHSNLYTSIGDSEIYGLYSNYSKSNLDSIYKLGDPNSCPIINKSLNEGYEDPSGSTGTTGATGSTGPIFNRGPIIGENKCDISNTCLMDVPYKLALNGCDIFNGAEIDGKPVNSSKDTINLQGQIKYLVAQLIGLRNRKYDTDDFIKNTSGGIYKFFSSLSPGLRIPFVFVFIITMYYLISGFFSSFDVTANVINIIQKNSTASVSYWIGILIGIGLPIIVISYIYNNISSNNINQPGKYQIYDSTNKQNNSAEGTPTKQIDTKQQNIDYTILILFILLIYGFVGVLFTIKKSSFNNYIYSLLVTIILVIIGMLIYMLYAYIPYYNSTDGTYMFRISNIPLKLYIDNQDQVSNIISNQEQDVNTQSIYFYTGIIICILSILFFYLNKSLKISPTESSILTILKSFGSGFLGSCAILVIPIFWVINFSVGLQYFYIYPMFLIILRYIRYFFSMILYFSTKNSSKASFSDDFVKELENFKDYTPSWGLLGIEEYKTLLGMFGYENLFSKSIISENNNSYDISNNKFVSSGFLYFFSQLNKGGIVMGSITIILTIVITVIILYGVLGINKI
jgi:hypothetical protein